MKMLRRKNDVVAALIVLLALIGLMPLAAAQGEKLGLLRIVKAEYPVQVPHSYSFTVKLKIEYAFREYFEIHAAIYEGAKGLLDNLLWESKPERLIEVGQKTYDVELRSPSHEGLWIITGYVFFHNASGSFYFSDRERGPGFVEMSVKVADNARLTLRARYGSIPVYVDGALFSTDRSGILVREVKVLTEHMIAAPRNVSIAEGRRVIFKTWNGTDPKNPKMLVITSDLLLTIEFRDEFYLDVVSNVADARGAGWYPSGAIANFSASSFVPSKGWENVFGVKWSFVGWSGDIDSAAVNESIVMDRPHRVVANWTVDYGRLYYLIIVAAVLVAVGLAVFLGRRIAKRRSDEAGAAPVRTFCMFCGADINPDARFCSKCGRSQVSSG